MGLLSVSPIHFMQVANDYGAYYLESGIFKSESSNTPVSNFMQSPQSDDTDTLSIVALALSCVAIAAVVASLFANQSKKSNNAETVVATTAAVKEGRPDDSKKSLG